MMMASMKVILEFQQSELLCHVCVVMYRCSELWQRVIFPFLNCNLSVLTGNSVSCRRADGRTQRAGTL